MARCAVAVATGLARDAQRGAEKRTATASGAGWAAMPMALALACS